MIYIHGRRDYPSALVVFRAAKHVVDRKSVNGWRFWYIKNSDGDWVKFGLISLYPG